MTKRQNFQMIALALACAATANAANLMVSNLNDSGTGSLREAINLANGNSDADTIQFGVSGTILLRATLPDITSQMTIDCSGQSVTISGGGAVQVMSVAPAGSLTLRFITVASGHSKFGGGILNNGSLTIESSNFLNNDASDPSGFGVGGGIENIGTVTIRDTTFSGNHAIDFGGAVHSFTTTGVTISGSTFSNNHSRSGGAMWVQGGGPVTISNSTFSGNIAGDAGGGILNATTLTLTNDTFSGNGAHTGGGIQNDGGEILNIGNTILAYNTGGDCANFGIINVNALNLVKDGSCAIQGALAVDPKLGPLADNGGPTQTFALLAGSPGIDAGNDSVCQINPVNNKDQRGESRPSGAHCDLGSFELQQTPLLPFTGFFAPVDNLPVVNTLKAGQGVPVKFSLGGDHGLDIFAAEYPKSQAMACNFGSPSSEIEATSTAGGSSLSYDAVSTTYTYVWKTDKAWSGTCRQLVVQLKDGTFHTANFQFR